jgi:hypothetical protein
VETGNAGPHAMNPVAVGAHTPNTTYSHSGYQKHRPTFRVLGYSGLDPSQYDKAAIWRISMQNYFEAPEHRSPGHFATGLP